MRRRKRNGWHHKTLQKKHLKAFQKHTKSPESKKVQDLTDKDKDKIDIVCLGESEKRAGSSDDSEKSISKDCTDEDTYTLATVK